MGYALAQTVPVETSLRSAPQEQASKEKEKPKIAMYGKKAYICVESINLN